MMVASPALGTESQQGGPASPGARFFAIDLLKAVAAVTVVAIHASPPTTGASGWAWLGVGRLFQFAVPTFLFCSGFLLQVNGPLRWTLTRRRLVRVLQPYLFATVLALVYHGVLRGRPVHPLRDLLLGSAFGPYYYVFLIVGLIALSPLISQLGELARRLFTLKYVVVGALLGGSLPTGPLAFWLGLLVPPAMVLVSLRQRSAWRAALALWPIQWGLALGMLALRSNEPDFTAGVALHLRNPAFHWGYFLIGWEIRAWLADRQSSPDDGGALLAERWRSPARWAAVAMLLLAVALGVRAFLEPHGMMRWPRFLYSVAIIIAVVAATVHRSGSTSGPLRSLSDASYTVFLFHLFAVEPLKAALPVAAAGGAMVHAVVALRWAAGLALPLALVIASRKFPRLGPWIGMRS